MNRQVTETAAPPRDGLLRTAPFSLRADDGADDGDGRTLDGYAAVFGRETIIDSWEGRFREVLRAGSMKKSFRETKPKIQFDHGRHSLIGSIPIATPVDGYPREDSDPELAPDGGAHIVARLAENWLIEPIRDAIASRAVDGMSFRFGVVQERWYDADGKQLRTEDDVVDALIGAIRDDVGDHELPLRELREVKVPEMGPVVWPAYASTSVGVRSKTIIDLRSLHDPETRKLLARAVLLADASERTDGETPPATDDPHEGAADGHEEPEVESDEPRATDDEPAGEHTSHTEDQADTEPPAPVAPAARYADTLTEPADWYLPNPHQTGGIA